MGLAKGFIPNRSAARLAPLTGWMEFFGGTTVNHATARLDGESALAPLSVGGAAQLFSAAEATVGSFAASHAAIPPMRSAWFSLW